MDGSSFFTIAQDILDCVVDRLNSPEPTAPTHQHVAIGEVVWDNCCESTGSTIGGQVWFSIDSIYPSRTPPLPDTSLVSCSATSFVMTGSVGLLRCWPTMADDGTPPTPAVLQAATEGILDDIAALIEGVSCCARLNDYDLIVGQSAHLIDGGCIGIGLPVTVVLGPCIDCSWQVSVEAFAGVAEGNG